MWLRDFDKCYLIFGRYLSFSFNFAIGFDNVGIGKHVCLSVPLSACMPPLFVDTKQTKPDSSMEDPETTGSTYVVLYTNMIRIKSLQEHESVFFLLYLMIMNFRNIFIKA